MNHDEKWQRIGEIDSRLLAVDLEFKSLAKEKSDLLMTQASDETEFLTKRTSEALAPGRWPRKGKKRMIRTQSGWARSEWRP